MNSKIERFMLFFSCLLLILSVDFGIAYSQEIFDNGHDGDGVFIFINGQEKSLQDAIDGGDFFRDYTGGRLHGPVQAGHVDNIFVNVNGFDKSLQDAINDGSLCSSSLGGDKVYSEDVLLGHSAEDVLVDFNGEKSLQDAINEGLFGYGVWSPSASSYCDTETFTQYNCGRSRTGVWGTMDCSIPAASPGSIDIQEFAINLEVGECYHFTISSSNIVGSLTYSTSGGVNCITSNGLSGLKWNSVGFKTYAVSGTDELGNTVSDVARIVVSCTDTSWSPDPSTVCSGDSFTQTSNCGNTRTAYGTKYCAPTCVDTSWSPDPSTVCDGKPFLQISNCGTRTIGWGTMDCCFDTSWYPFPESYCSTTTFLQISNCGTTRYVSGTKAC